MDNKKTILAILLSVVVLIGWSVLTSKFYHVENKEVTKLEPKEEIGQIPPESLPRAQVLPKTIVEFPETSLIHLNRTRYEVTFIEPQAAIKEIKFFDYQDHKFVLSQGFYLSDGDIEFKKTSSTENSIIFEHDDTNKKIIKEYIFDNASYCMELSLIVINKSAVALPLNFLATRLEFSPSPEINRFQDIALAFPNTKTIFNNARKDKEFENVKFLGWRDRYFCGIIEPQNSNYSVTVSKVNPSQSLLILNSKALLVPAGQEIMERFKIYLGPQETAFLAQGDKNWTTIINYGTFDPISRILNSTLNIIYKIVRNWGLAVILLSILIYFILYPLSIKQMHSIKQMQLLQPKMEELKKMYKDNPQKLNRATLELYKENKINPFGGCLPLILQIPIFFALYQALIRSIALKGAKFLWIKDLSEPDRIFMLPFSLPFLGNELNLLPILMAVVMLFQQKTSSGATSGVSSEQQKIMTIVFPIMFGVIFYKMPSGLVLYWFINSLLMFAFQMRMNLKK